MGNQNKKVTNKTTQNKKVSTYLIMPIALILLIVPLIVHMKTEPISASAIPFWKGGGSDSDFFSYYKMVWFLILTVVAVIALIMKFLNNNFKIKKTYLYIPMGVYTFFVIISTLLSKAKDVSTLGFPNRYEGMYVLIAYMVVLFIVINLLDNEKQLNLLLGGLFISSMIIGIIGTFQFFNMDFFQTIIGKKLMLPISDWGMADSLSFQLGKRAVYGTLYHTNYVGGFTAMLLPLALGCFILMEKRSYKIATGILSALMFLCLYASHSRTGIIGATLAVILLIILVRNHIMKNIKYVGVLLVILIVIFLGVNGISKGTVASKVGTLENDSSPSPTAAVGIKDLTATKDLITIDNGIGVFKADFVKGQSKFTDESNKPLKFKPKKKADKIIVVNPAGASYTYRIVDKEAFADPRFADIAINVIDFNKHPGIMIQKGTFNISFVITPDGYKLIDIEGNNAQILDINTIPRFGFKGNENFGSARGYIWSRSLPLLKDTVFAGFGPDTFAMHFPQNDYIGKILAYGTPAIIVDKPHNLYLNAGLSTGIISLLALLALFIMYFIFSIKIYFKQEFNTLLQITGVSTFVAVCGYLIASLANDSTVSVSPVFWIILGIGVSINMMLSGRKAV